MWKMEFTNNNWKCVVEMLCCVFTIIYKSKKKNEKQHFWWKLFFHIKSSCEIVVKHKFLTTNIACLYVLLTNVNTMKKKHFIKLQQQILSNHNVFHLILLHCLCTSVILWKKNDNKKSWQFHNNFCIQQKTTFFLWLFVNMKFYTNINTFICFFQQKTFSSNSIHLLLTSYPHFPSTKKEKKVCVIRESNPDLHLGRVES